MEASRRGNRAKSEGLARGAGMIAHSRELVLKVRAGCFAASVGPAARSIFSKKLCNFWRSKCPFVRTPLQTESTEILNMRAQSADEIIASLSAEELKPNLPMDNGAPVSGASD